MSKFSSPIVESKNPYDFTPNQDIGAKKKGAKFVDFLDDKSHRPKSSSQYDFNPKDKEESSYSSEYKNEEPNNKIKEESKNQNIKSPKEEGSDRDQVLNKDSSSSLGTASGCKKEVDLREGSFDNMSEDKNYCLLDEDKNINLDLVSRFVQIEPVIMQADYSKQDQDNEIQDNDLSRDIDAPEKKV